MNKVDFMDDPEYIERSFVPSAELWTYLQKVPRHIQLIDCQAGRGEFVKMARERGINIHGIDCRSTTAESEYVSLAEPISYAWGPTVWPLIIIPVGKWAPQTVIHARRNQASVLYVGLQREFFNDIGQQMSKRIIGKFGSRNEALYFMRPPPPSAKTGQRRPTLKATA